MNAAEPQHVCNLGNRKVAGKNQGERKVKYSTFAALIYAISFKSGLSMIEKGLAISADQSCFENQKDDLPQNLLILGSHC